jgi:hypothetical protein
MLVTRRCIEDVLEGLGDLSEEDLVVMFHVRCASIATWDHFAERCSSLRVDGEILVAMWILDTLVVKIEERISPFTEVEARALHRQIYRAATVLPRAVETRELIEHIAAFQAGMQIFFTSR